MLILEYISFYLIKILFNLSQKPLYNKCLFDIYFKSVEKVIWLGSTCDCLCVGGRREKNHTFALNCFL